MKRVFTLLFIFYTCAQFPAFAGYLYKGKVRHLKSRDTSVNRHLPDSTKVQAINRQQLLINDLLIIDKSNLHFPKNVDSLKAAISIAKADGSNLLAALIAEPDTFRHVISAIQLDSLKDELIIARIHQDSLRAEILQSEKVKMAELLKINDPDSLKMQLKRSLSDTLKGLIYTHLADHYLNYDTIVSKHKQIAYQNAVLNYTLLAIQQYAAYNDSTALQLSYDNLAKVYFAQEKYTQAKWFILQANTLARAKNDTANIISSLLTLSTIKSQIKDYNLAMRDLNEALQLSVATHAPKTESQVLKDFASLYHRMENYPKEAMVLKKRDSLEESLRKAEEVRLAALAASQKKKLDSLQNKKKVYSSNMHKLYKNGSGRKIASL